jgi:hypothetical protein
LSPFTQTLKIQENVLGILRTAMVVYYIEVITNKNEKGNEKKKLKQTIDSQTFLLFNEEW